MYKKWKIAIGVVAYAVAACAVLGFWKYHQIDDTDVRVWHHELAAEADTTQGVSEIPSDYMVDDTFTSHLPLIIIDTGGEEIVNYKVYNPVRKTHEYIEGIDTFLKMNISVIDNPDMVNALGDEPTLVSDGRIRIRGNYSSAEGFSKFQYLIKLDTPEGEKNPQEVLGMESSDTWILNGTQMDLSHLRNYVAMNTGGEVAPYTPDMRFCEMVLKQGEQYEYMGLYILYEKVGQGIGRVEIPEVSSPISLTDTAYILVRDRESAHGYNIEVYSTRNQNDVNWVTLTYPNEKKITEEYWNYIKEDISKIEDVLYSDNYKEFIEYRALLDVDSFVDYFVINEFFSNYDAGWNSTFLYKKTDGTLAVGPFWDFDGAMDNYKEHIMALEQAVFQTAPWFDQLVQDQYFVDKVVERYQQLRGTILDEDLIRERMEAATAFISMPAKRDASRWEGLYEHVLFVSEEETTGIAVDRSRESWEGEALRVTDVLQQHGTFLDTEIYDLYNLVEYSNSELYNTVIGALFIIVFFVSIILVQRVRKGA